MLNVGRATARSVHTTTGMPRRSLFEMVSCRAMTQVFASTVVTTTTVTTEGVIPVVASVASWAEFLADLEPATSRKISNRPEDAATDRRGIFLSVLEIEELLLLAARVGQGTTDPIS